jgi:hypothetical protein
VGLAWLGPNWFHVYSDHEAAMADLAGNYPRFCFLYQLAQENRELPGELAWAIIHGEDAALPILADALEDAGDTRAEQVRSWLRSRGTT